MTKGITEAMEKRAERPKIWLNESLTHRFVEAKGVIAERKEYSKNKTIEITPAKTKFFAILLPYTSPITSVMMNTTGKEKTATERCVPKRIGMSLIPKVLEAKSDVM